MSGFNNGSGNATQLQGRSISPVAPTDTQVLTWVAADSAWEPKPGGGGGGGGADALDTYIVTQAGAHNNANDVFFGTVNGYGPILSRPGSAIEGYIWFASDTFQFYRWTSGGWISVTPVAQPDATKLAIANNLSDVANAATSFKNISPLTTEGDVLLYTGGANARLGIGAGGLALVSNGTDPVYDNPFQSWQWLVVRPSSAIAETVPARILSIAGAVTITSGTYYVVEIALPAGKLCSSITMVKSSIAASGPTKQIFSLHDNNKNLLRSSNDDGGTAWAANSNKTLALTSTFTTTYTGAYYVGVLIVATTPGTLLGASQTTQLTPLGNPTNGNTSDTSISAPPNPFGTITQGSVWAYAAVN